MTRSVRLRVWIDDAAYLRYVAAPLPRPWSGPTLACTMVDGSRTTAWTRTLPTTIQTKGCNSVLRSSCGALPEIVIYFAPMYKGEIEL